MEKQRNMFLELNTPKTENREILRFWSFWTTGRTRKTAVENPTTHKAWLAVVHFSGNAPQTGTSIEERKERK